MRVNLLSSCSSVYPDHVYYGGAVRGESAMEYLDDIGVRVMHTYNVFNKGPWKVGSLEVHIEWPFQVANNKPQGKWLLYLEDVPSVEGLLCIHIQLILNVCLMLGHTVSKSC